MKISSFIVIFLVSLFAFGQELLPQRYDTLVFQHDLRIEGMGYHHSSHLRNDFSGAFLFGGFLSDDIKTNSMPGGEENGRVGGEVNGELIYRNGSALFKRWENIGWQVKIGSYQQFGVGFTSDAYGLALFGNEGYLDNDAVFSNTAGFALGFHKLGFGLLDRTKKHSVTLNLLLGTNAFNFDVNRGVLAFDESGETMDYNMDVTIRSGASHTAFNGIGVALDFEIFASIVDVPGLQGVFQVSGRNLGIMHNPNMTQWNFTGSGSYAGFSINEFSELLTFNSAQLNNFMDSLGLSSNTISRTGLIPGGFIQAGKIVSDDVESNFQSFFGVRVLTNLIHKPMVYGGGHFDFSDWGSAGLQVSFGGYGGFRVGSYFGMNFHNFSLGLGTEDVLGLASSTFFGRSLLTRLVWKI